MPRVGSNAQFSSAAASDECLSDSSMDGWRLGLGLGLGLGLRLRLQSGLGLGFGPTVAFVDFGFLSSSFFAAGHLHVTPTISIIGAPSRAGSLETKYRIKSIFRRSSPAQTSPARPKAHGT